MPKVKSSIRSTSRSGSTSGVSITDRDKSRLALIGRWYCLSVEHIVRSELDPDLWMPNRPSSQTAEARKQWQTTRSTTYRRLWKLRSIPADPARQIGPLADADLAYTGTSAWFTTRYGGTAAGLPWTMRSGINPIFSAHAWMAADIGMAIEAEGHRVLSERELSTGIDRNGTLLPDTLESVYTGPSGSDTKKKPDVAVLAPNGQDYIAIEIERDRSRSVKVYEEKLTAYRGNTSIKAVWYICESATTARRVVQGANRVFGDAGSYPLRITVIEPENNYHFLDMHNLKQPMQADLDALHS